MVHVQSKHETVIEIAARISGTGIGLLLRKFLLQGENCQQENGFLERIIALWANPFYKQVDEDEWVQLPSVVPVAFESYCFMIVKAELSMLEVIAITHQAPPVLEAA